MPNMYSVEFFESLIRKWCHNTGQSVEEISVNDCLPRAEYADRKQFLTAKYNLIGKI